MTIDVGCNIGKADGFTITGLTNSVDCRPIVDSVEFLCRKCGKKIKLSLYKNADKEKVKNE